MYVITKEVEFDAGHRVPLHASKCRNPHGHRYKVQAVIQGELITTGPESGMVRDFSIVKELLTKHAVDKYDHGFIIADTDEEMLEIFGVYGTDASRNPFGYKIIVTDFYPTAECLARQIFEDMWPELPGLLAIKLWETPSSVAEYWSDRS